MLNKWPQKPQYNPAIYCTTFLCVDNKSIDYNPGNQRGGDLFRPFQIAFCSFVWTWQWLYFRRYWLIFKDWNSSCPLYYFTLMLGLYLITLKWQMGKKCGIVSTPADMTWSRDDTSLHFIISTQSQHKHMHVHSLYCKYTHV